MDNGRNRKMNDRTLDWMNLVSNRASMLVDIGMEPGQASFLATNFLNLSETDTTRILQCFRRFESPTAPAQLFFKERHACFYNSACNAEHHQTPLLLVEGFATSVIPMLHAWNITLPGIEVLDATWYNGPNGKPGENYFGVVVRPEFMRKHTQRCFDEGTYHSILDLTFFRPNPPADLDEMFFKADEALSL